MSAVDDLINKYGASAPKSSVGGPKGLAPAAAQQQGSAVDDLLANHGGSFGSQDQTDMTGTYRSWYTGQNLEGTKGGWDTDFQKTFQDKVDKAYANGNIFDYFADENAVGVVTWDNANSSDPGVKFKFGDVVEGGKKVGNVYEDFDRHTANVMMGEYVVQTGARKGQLNQADDIAKAWDEEVGAMRAENTRLAEVAPRAKEFEANVKHELETDDDRAGIVLGGGVGGATLGGGIGTMIAGPVGTAIGGGIGFGIGAVAAWLNSDSLTYQLARSQEQLKIASAEGAGIQAALSTTAQNVMSVGLSPLQNLVQGTYDALGEGGVTGGTIGGEFHEVNAEGERKAGFGWQALDIAGLIGDSALQLASPAGRAAYQVQMSTQIAAGAIGLLPGQGSWDPTMLRQDNVWTTQEYNPQTQRYEEKFDLGNAAAGIGNVGIDVVQLGAFSSLARNVDRLAGQTAKATGEAVPYARTNRFDVLSRTNLSSEQRAALKAGGELEVKSGYKFVLDAEGQVVGKARGTMAMLAPSEGLQALSAKMLARRDAARRGGALEAEDLYNTAAQLAHGQKNLTTLLVNAVGEGQEEVAQALLEPWSQDHAVNVEDVMRAGLSGAAAGFGMTAGARLGRPSQDLQMYSAAMVGHMARTGGDKLEYSDWQQMSELQKRTMVKAAEGLAKTLTDSAYDKIEKDRIRGTVAGVVGAQRLEDYQRDELEAALKTGAEATDQANTIVMHESYTFRPEAFATSHTQMLQNQQDRTKGAVVQLDEIGKDIAEIKEMVTDPAQQAAHPRLTELREEYAALAKVVDASQVLERTIARYVTDIDAAFELDDAPLAETIIDEMNDMLEGLFDMTDDTYELVMKDGTRQSVTLNPELILPYAKAASRLLTRDPADSKGSWQMLLPQVDKVWAARRVDGLYGVNQIVLQAVRGDFDGDKMRTLQQLIVNDQRYKDIRSGANILGVTAMPEVGSSKHEKFLTMRVMQSWDSRNVPLREAARRVARDIERSLYERYHNAPQGKTPIPSQVIRDVSAAAQDALMTGQDVRKVVLKTMQERAGNQLTAIGRGEFHRPGEAAMSNEAYWMAHMITGHMTNFQEAYASHSTPLGEFDPNFTQVTADRTTTRAADRAPLRGVTESATAIQELPGSNMFRMFQKLHYTLYESTQKYVGWAEQASNSQYIELVEFYERLSQGVTRQRNDRMSPNDQILGQVHRWLDAMAADPVERERLNISEDANKALIANVGMPQMVWGRDADGRRQMKYTGHTVTIGQHLLYLSLEQFKSENRDVWQDNAEARAAYNNLFDLTKPSVQGTNPGNAEQAWVEIFEATRLYDLLGADAVALGVNRTVGQAYRGLISLSVDERSDQKFAAKTGRYKDAAKGATIPFGEAELKAGQVTSYKSVIDSLFSAADSTITMNVSGKDRGEVHGRLAKQDSDRGKAFRKSWRAVQTLLDTLDPHGGKRTADDIARLSNENVEFGQALLATIPHDAIPFVLKKTDEQGIPTFSTWFYEVWTQDTAEKAEMSYFRNYVTNTWFAQVLKHDMDFARGDKDTERKIAFHDLKSRMHRVMFRLASSADMNSIRFEAFLSKLNEADNVAEFMKWLNAEEGLNLEGPPLLAWVDDVSVFDPDKANGGWSSGNMSAPLLMEHINSLRKTAERLVGDLSKESKRAKADVNTGRAVERWLNHLKDPDNPRVPADPNDEVVYKRFVKLLETASKRRMSNGPRAMLQHTAHLVHGMYSPAAAKGQHPDQMAANAALEAMDNAFGYLTTPERLLGDLTAHNEDAVAKSPQMMLRDGGTTMNRWGQQVHWSMNAVEAMLPLVLNKDAHQLMRSVLFDTVVELDSDNVARRKFLMGSTLDAVMSNTTLKDLFPDEGNPDLQQSLKFLVKLEQRLRDSQKHQIEQMVTELVINRVMALGSPATFEEIQGMTTKAYMDYAALIEVVSQTDPGINGEDPAHVAFDQLKKAMQAIALSDTFNIPVDAFVTTTDDLKVLVRKEMLDPYTLRIDRMLTDMENPNLTDTQREELQGKVESEKRVLEAMKAKVEKMFDLDVIDTVVASLSYNPEASESDKRQRQDELMQYVYNHGELSRQAGPALTSVTAILRHYDETPRDRKIRPFKLTDEAWSELSNVIISKEITDLLTVTPADNVAPPYPASLEQGATSTDKQKYWDHTRSYLFGFLSKSDSSGILEVARQMAVDAGKVPPQYGRDDIVKKVQNTVLRQDELGPWDPAIPIMAAESAELLQGASAIPSISMHGLIQQRWGASMRATRRQTKDTVADATVVITGDDLNWREHGPFNEVEVTAGNGEKYMRPLAQLSNRFAEELSFTYTQPDGTPADVVDLMTHKNVAWTWYPAKGEVPATKFKQVNLTRLDEELSRILKNNHPTADESQMRTMLDSARVSMRFVNPDAQPATPDHANSVWHEGTVYLSDGDVGDNLIEAFFYGIGAINATGQQAALDTRKLALMGIEDYNRPERRAVLDMEARAGLDFAGMLTEKTNALMDTAISNGKPLDVNLYNAAYKIMKLKHWLEGTDPASGTRVRLSAEQVTAWQMANPGKDIFGQEGPLTDAVLWKPSDQVLADMLGEIGFGGVKGRSLKRGVTVDLTTIPLYESTWSSEMERKFPIADSQPTDILATDAARQAYVQDLKVSSFVTPAERTKYQRRQDAFVRMRERASSQRTKDVNARSKTFNPQRNAVANMETVTQWVANLDVQLNLPEGRKFLAMEQADLLESTLSALDSYTSEHRGIVGVNDASFWIFQEDGQSDAEAGRLTASALTGKLNIVPGEVVFFDTAPYRDMDPDKAREMALKRIGWFVDHGAALMIGSSNGHMGLISELQGLTRERHGYKRYENNNNILVPQEIDETDYQNVAAARSRLAAPAKVNIIDQRLSLLFSDLHVEENTMWIPVRPGRRGKFDTVQVAFDLLPIDAHTKFNAANTRDTAKAIQNRILGLGDINSAGVDMLRQEALRHLYKIDDDGKATTELAKGVTDQQVTEETREFNRAWEAMKLALDARVENNTSEPQVGERFQTGDFIPLINAETGELMMYRHGYEFPDEESLQRQLVNQVPGHTGERGIAMYSGERVPQATTHAGTVAGVVPSPGRGFRLELEIDVREIGQKISVEHNGMKYVLTHLPKNVVLPSIPLFGNVDIDGLASLHDVIAKEATGGLNSNFQTLFTIFGVDFMPDLQRFFGLENTGDVMTLLRRIAALPNKMSVAEVYQRQSLMAGQDAYVSAITRLLPQLMVGTEAAPWMDNLSDATPEAFIARAALIYLMSPGADVNAILYSSGFNVTDPSAPGAVSQRMPELFTRAFDLSAPGSEIRNALRERVNAKLNRNGNERWDLNLNTWELEGVGADGTPIRGMLQYGEAHVTDDNIESNLSAHERKVSQTASVHQALMNMIGTGGTLRPGKARNKIARLDALRKQDLTGEEAGTGKMWRDLTFVNPQTTGSGARWQERTVAEHRFERWSRARMVLYRQPIDFKAKAFSKDEVQTRQIEQAIQSVRRRAGLRKSEEERVHYWIRQMLYHPAESSDQDAFEGDLAPADVLGAIKAIQANMDDGYYPTYDSAGPSFFSYQDLLVLQKAAQRNPDSAFRPYRKDRDPKSKVDVDNLGEWIAVAFGQAINEKVEFDPIYRLDFSGFMNTYQTVLRNSGQFMDITFDKKYQQKLLDPKSNELLTVTIDPVEETRLRDQVILATANLEYEDLMSGATTGDSVAWRQRRLAARARWRKRRSVHPVKVKSSRDFYRNGTETINRDADMHSLQRMVISLRHGTAMLNPGLYFSMIPEQGFRMFLSEATNLLSGQSTLQTTSFLERQTNRVLGGVTGGKTQLSFTQYSPEQIRDLNKLFEQLGADGAFSALIMKDLMFTKNPVAPNKATAFFEKFAAIGNWWQDPTRGTTQKALARHYFEAIMRSIEAMPTRNVMDVDQVIATLRTDPGYFAKHEKELHQMASNAVVDFRSLKNTPYSLAIKSMYDPWSQSPNAGKRFIGTLLKMQGMYATYNMNVLTSITGMQGYTDMLAAFVDGRRTPKSFLKTWYKARDDESITDEDYETMDMSTVIDGVTIANSFIKGGVTHTGLFMLGMAAGGVLSGEDDEAKRRRRLAEAQNAPLIMDPRRLENDFRNKDAIFLDWMPPQLAAFFRVQGDDGSQGSRAMVQMSWILKPFLSPILGMERFFMTGDFDYVTQGFMDAIGSMPLINKDKWDDVVRSAKELEVMAADQQEAGTPTATKNTTYLLANIVGMYENMLVENMFVNSLYAGFDMYDRDPTKLMLRDSDGDIQRTIENDARKNDLALTEYMDDNGTPNDPTDDRVKAAYKERDPLSAQLAAYTEGHFTAAAMLSLFKPIHHQEFFRGDMPIVERTIKREGLTDDQAKVAVILATLQGQKAQGTLERRLSLDEVTFMLKDKYMKSKNWDAYNNLDANALAFYNSDQNPKVDPLTFLGANGQELLTKAGQVALIKGIQGGTITLDDPEIKGMAISIDQRKELERDFFNDMTRQGVDLGLTLQQAQKRATRLMIGPIDDPTIKGFKDILNDKRIPTTADLKYKQLNTTYVTGPDGFPWATGFKRGGAPGMGGFWSLLGGVKKPAIGMTDAVSQDGRMNTVDEIAAVATGMRGVVPFNKTENIPTDLEQTDMILDALRGQQGMNSYVPNSRDTGNSGGGGFYRRGGYGGGGGGYSPTIYWSRQPTLPRGANIYGNSPRNLFWNNANIRRTTIRRERYQSERGRLNQWQ